MFKTKNLFALMALGSALTLVGCGDDDNSTPVTTEDGGTSGSDTSTDPVTDTDTEPTDTSSPASSGSTGTSAPVDGDAGDGGETSAPVDGDAGDAGETSVPVDSTIPAVDAGDAG